MFVQGGIVVDKQAEASSDVSLIEMSVKDAAYQVLIDMKTKITSYGPHNGIIIHCGIQQETDIFWPYISNDAAKSLSSQQFDVAPTPATIHWSAVKNSDDNRRNKSALRMSNQLYPLTAEDKISSDNFNTSENIRLNVFETNSVMAELRSFDMESVLGDSLKSDSTGTVFKIFNDDAANTGGLLTAKNADSPYWPTANAKKTMNKETLNQNMRTAASCEHYNDPSDEVAKYDYNQIENEFAKNPSLGEIPMITNDPKIIGESKSQKITHLEFSEHLAGSFIYSSNQQRQQYRSLPDLCQAQSNHKEVPEQLYHLYEIQDAFGNLLAQFEMEIEISEQFLSPMSSSHVSKKPLSTDYDENNRNSTKNFGLSLIPENVLLESRVKDGNHMESLVKYLQQCSQSSTNIFSSIDILRHACGSLYAQSVIPTSLKKVQESVVHKKSGEIKKLNVIAADETKNFKKISTEHLEVLPIKKLSTMNYEQLEVTAEQGPQKQKLMEKEENFENILQKLRNRNMEIRENTVLENLDNIRSAITIPLKSILHISSRKSSLIKKVRFPAEQQQVVALEHRLLIDDLDLV